MTIDLTQLAKEFPQEAISWRAQSVTRDGSKAMALAYIDARDVMKRLDEVCGLAGWQCRYPHANGKTICEIGIKCKDEWVWKADGSGDTDIEAEKGAISDAFKRAAVKWGIGRYLYDMGTPWVPCESYEGNDGKKKFSKFLDDPWSCIGKPVPINSGPSAAPQAAFDVVGVKELISLGIKAKGLGEFEQKFINDWFDKLSQYGDKIKAPSDKQMEILKKIAAKVKPPTAPANDFAEPPSYVTEGPEY